MAENKPLLFLDVDGVLNILPGVLETRKAPPAGFATVRVPLGAATVRSVLVSREIGEGLRSLSDDVEIVWLSHWNSRANVLGRLIGLPRLDFVAVPPFASPWGKTYGMRVEARSYGRPIFWVDDHSDPRQVFDLQEHLGSAYFAALQTDPAVGLRLQDIDLIRSEIALLA